MDYEFSATELADIHQDYPDLAKRMRNAIERGQLRLVNGTYSQPHLHTLSLGGIGNIHKSKQKLTAKPAFRFYMSPDNDAK